MYISKLFCNKTSQFEHSTYASNHTLEYLDGVEHHTLLNSLLEMNRGTNKSHVAMKKVLRRYATMSEWDLEGKRNLKGLPHMVLGLKELRKLLRKIKE